MPTVSIRELARNTSEVVDGVEKTGRPALVTRRGKPVAVLVPLDEEQLEDYLLSTSRDIVESLREAEEEITAGKTRPLDDVLAEMNPAR